MAAGAKPEAAKLLARAESRQAKADGAGTKKALEEATAADPAFVPAQLSLAMLLDGAREWDAASTRYREVIERSPNNIVALNNRCTCWRYTRTTLRPRFPMRSAPMRCQFPTRRLAIRSPGSIISSATMRPRRQS